MATIEQVTDAGIALRSAVQAKVDDGDFTAAARSRFEVAHLLFSRCLSAFAISPASGGASPTYDAPLAAEQNAAALIAACSPTDVATIDAALSATRGAADALAGITASTATASSAFASALAVRRNTGRAGGAIGAAAAGEDPAPVPPPGSATEPYLTSLAKLFPAEALSALLLVLAIDEQFEVVRYVLISIIALVSGGLRYLSSRDPDTGRPDILAVFVSVVSFLIYATAMLAFGVLFHTNEATTRIVATVAAILWMAMLTAIVRKAPAL